jgi:hypothetical protein
MEWEGGLVHIKEVMVKYRPRALCAATRLD